MPIIVGTTVNDIAGLEITNGDHSQHQIVMIPGYVSIKNPNKSFTELLEISGEFLTQQTAIEVYEKQKQIILNGGYGKGKSLDITHNAIYDIIVKAVGFNYKQLVRDSFVELKLKIEDQQEIESMRKRLANAKRQNLAELVADIEEEIEESLDILGDMSIDIAKSTYKSSERSTINQVSNELRIPVRVSDHGDYYKVTYKPDSRRHPKSTGRGGMKTSAITTWLLTLKPYTPTKPPAELVTTCTDSYFRTVLNKSGLFASYRRGLVTIYRAGIRHGSLVVDGKTIGPVRNADHLSLLLAPHGLSVSQCMGSERV